MKVWWRDQKFYRQQKAKIVQHHQNCFIINNKGISPREKSSLLEI